MADISWSFGEQRSHVNAVTLGVREPNIRQIIEVVAEFYEVNVNDILSTRRSPRITRARWVAMHIARVMTKKSYTTIARSFGDKDHASVTYAMNGIQRRIKEDERIADEVEILKLRLEACCG